MLRKYEKSTLKIIYTRTDNRSQTSELITDRNNRKSDNITGNTIQKSKNMGVLAILSNAVTNTG